MEDNDRPRAFVIAANYVTAVNVVEFEWWWPKASGARWISPAGEIVSYVTSAQELRGRVSAGTRVYQAEGWDERPARDLMELRQLVSAGKIVLVAHQNTVLAT